MANKQDVIIKVSGTPGQSFDIEVTRKEEGLKTQKKSLTLTWKEISVIKKIVEHFEFN